MRWGVGLAGCRERPYAALTRALKQPVHTGPATAVARWVRRQRRDDTLVIDDVQFADADTLALLPLLTGCGAVVVIVRDGEPGTAAAVETLTGAFTHRIALGPLSRADTVELMVQAGASAARARELADLTRGNPLWCRELAAGAPSRILEASVAAQLTRLDPAARASVLALGLLGRPCEAGVLGGGVAAAVDAGLCEMHGATVHLRADLVGRVAVARTDELTRRRVQLGLRRRITEQAEVVQHSAARADPTSTGPTSTGPTSTGPASTGPASTEVRDPASTAGGDTALTAFRPADKVGLAPDVAESTRLPLSEREAQILRLVGQGLPSRLIAARLGISATTVDSHVRAAVRKLGAENRRHAAGQLR
jgi:DNA-binding CsgD family transcriptional regulator